MPYKAENYGATVSKGKGGKGKGKVEKILKGSLDLIQSPSPSVKIEIIGGKVCLLHFVAFFHVASLFSTGVDNEKVWVDNEKALELTNSTEYWGRQ